MSTRANVIIKDGYGDEIMFYRHSDGYPEGVAATLGEFISLVKEGRIRDNAEQSAGWLILLGHEEYAKGGYGSTLDSVRKNKDTNISGWKVGAYEPSVDIHGDIEYLYEIDLKAKTLRGWHYHVWEKMAKGEEVTGELDKAIASEAPEVK